MNTKDSNTFQEQINSYLQGTPDEALLNAGLMRSALPVLRADFLMCGAYVYRPRHPLPCPVHVFGGVDDAVRREECRLEADLRVLLRPVRGRELDYLAQPDLPAARARVAVEDVPAPDQHAQ